MRGFIQLNAPDRIVAEVLRCPRDGSKAVLESVQGPKGYFKLDVCQKCGGAWFDKGEITRISGEREIERMIVEYADGSSGLACPRCGRDMVSRPVGEIKLDVCAKCRGVWIDSGELEKAARTLGGEFSDVSGEGVFAESARISLITSFVFGTHVTMSSLLEPRIKRRYSPDIL